MTLAGQRRLASLRSNASVKLSIALIVLTMRAQSNT